MFISLVRFSHLLNAIFHQIIKLPHIRSFEHVCKRYWMHPCKVYSIQPSQLLAVGLFSVNALLCTLNGVD